MFQDLQELRTLHSAPLQVQRKFGFLLYLFVLYVVFRLPKQRSACCVVLQTSVRDVAKVKRFRILAKVKSASSSRFSHYVVGLAGKPRKLQRVIGFSRKCLGIV